MSERKCKTVSFDLSDVYEADLLEYAESCGKFSRYIKRLIEAERSGGNTIKRVHAVVSDTDDDDALSLL